MKINKLPLNTNKTKFMVLTKQRLARHFDIRIGKTNIEQVNEIKYLGVIFNDKLSWKSHIQHVYSSGFWALLKLRNYVDTTTLNSILCFNLLLSLILCLNVGTGFNYCPGSTGKNTQMHNQNYYQLSFFLAYKSVFSKIEFFKTKKYC